MSMPAVAERLRRAYPAPLGRAGVGSIPANPDAQHVPSFRRWRFEMKLSPFMSIMFGATAMWIGRTSCIPPLYQQQSLMQNIALHPSVRCFSFFLHSVVFYSNYNVCFHLAMISIPLQAIASANEPTSTRSNEFSREKWNEKINDELNSLRLSWASMRPSFLQGSSHRMLIMRTPWDSSSIVLIILISLS